MEILTKNIEHSGRKPDDLTGLKFKTWIIVEFSHRKSGKLYWKCECLNCQKTRIFVAHSIRANTAGSCECSNNFKTHYLSIDVGRTRFLELMRQCDSNGVSINKAVIHMIDELLNTHGVFKS